MIQTSSNSQLASNSRIITPSFHLSSILMAERDKQIVNAPGVCVITHCTVAKARSCAQAHTKIRRNTTKINNFVFSTSVRLQLSREDRTRDNGKQRQEEEREG